MAGETSFLEVSEMHLDDPLPFESGEAAASSSGAPTLSLSQLAAVVVELELAPGNSKATLQHYGLTAESWREASSSVQSRRRGDPQVQAEWERALGEYRAWRIRG